MLLKRGVLHITVALDGDVAHFAAMNRGELFYRFAHAVPKQAVEIPASDDAWPVSGEARIVRDSVYRELLFHIGTHRRRFAVELKWLILLRFASESLVMCTCCAPSRLCARFM